MNKWNIPEWLEKTVMDRDRKCVYCCVPMTESSGLRGPRKAVGSWEHIDNDETNISLENIARCCTSCNSSKGTKKLSVWLESDYCEKHGISKDTAADVVKRALFLS